MHLRKWAPEDVKLVQEASCDAYIASMIRIHRNCTAHDARHWIQRRRTQVIVESGTGEALGEVGLDNDRTGCCGQLFYWILPRARGRGLVTEAAELVLARAGKLVVTAFVSDRNLASRRVLEKLGFIRAGESTLWAGYPGPRDTYSYFRVATG